MTLAASARKARTTPDIDASPRRAGVPARPAGRPVKRAHSLVDLWLGEQLRQLRKEQGRSLTDVARACGMSVGLLSQIERGMSSISVNMLRAVARELHVSPDALLRNAEHDDGSSGGHVARAGTHRVIRIDEKGIAKEVVTPPAARAMDLCRITIAPGGSTGDALFVTDKGEQVGIVLTGQLELRIEDRVLLLRAGDSFCYASRTPRRWRNPGDTDTEVVWAISNIADDGVAAGPAAAARPGRRPKQGGG
ncbi:helix-turn-helix domain-containing protein [Bordetella genomosp. 9]|uniref:XRE family transcriptional regulator n=1 Tax=Bordetella genomosp. 9 TaxID=1416803 RepID=A0A1W6YV01_9BORD|nr:XRE family transcriptional regulator [Bordetella genomosp. 9]ARP84932.1 XRE family transcriptional regulator [Bordetella genomosp. 9]ARP89018.1 XRE family transcriptional regulator [Bordetella genomosp. 9]